MSDEEQKKDVVEETVQDETAEAAGPVAEPDPPASSPEGADSAPPTAEASEEAHPVDRETAEPTDEIEAEAKIEGAEQA